MQFLKTHKMAWLQRPLQSCKPLCTSSLSLSSLSAGTISHQSHSSLAVITIRHPCQLSPSVITITQASAAASASGAMCHARLARLPLVPDPSFAHTCCNSQVSEHIHHTFSAKFAAHAWVLSHPAVAVFIFAACENQPSAMHAERKADLTACAKGQLWCIYVALQLQLRHRYFFDAVITQCAQKLPCVGHLLCQHQRRA